MRGMKEPKNFRLFIIGLLAFSCFAITSCRILATSKTTGANTPSIRENVPYPEVHASKTPTPIPTNTPTPNNNPGSLNTATFTRTPRPTPTFSLPFYVTVTATFPVLPTPVSISPSTNVALVRPEVKDLLDAVKIVNQQYAGVQNSYTDGNDPLYRYQYNEIREVNDILNYEFIGDYLGDIPDPGLIWKYYPLESGWFPLYPDKYLDLLTQAVYAMVQEKVIILSDQMTYIGNKFKVEVHKVEIDKEPGAEWLLLIRWEALGALTWLTIDETGESKYRELNSDLPKLTGSSNELDDRILILQDFTGDGQTDIIFLDYGYFWGTDFGTFYVARGIKDGFVLLSSISQSIPGYLSTGLLYSIGTPDNSKWLTLTISNPNSINWDCYWETVTNYRWPYGKEQVTTINELPPKSTDCYLAQAVEIDYSLDNRSAIQYLEYAISRLNPSDPVQSAKIQFSHFRLSVLYALEDMTLPAYQHLQLFVASIKDNPSLSDILKPLLEEDRINPFLLCDRVANLDISLIPIGWRNYVNATGALNAYPKNVDPYPPAICPLSNILSDELNKIIFDPISSPEQVLIENGFPVASTYEYPVPGQDHPSWFALLGEETKYVVGYILGPQGWHWHLIYRFAHSTYSPQVFYQDTTGDGFPELGFYLRMNQNYGCDENFDGYYLLLTTATDFGLVTLDNFICNSQNNPKDITFFLTDDDKDGLVDWVVNKINETYGEEKLSTERMAAVTWFSPSEISAWINGANAETRDSEVDIVKKLFLSTNPAVEREYLRQYRDNLDPNNELTPRMWQRLTYLIAISYELEGLDEYALKAYMELMSAQPYTIWGVLAAMHVRVK